MHAVFAGRQVLQLRQARALLEGVPGGAGACVRALAFFACVSYCALGAIEVLCVRLTLFCDSALVLVSHCALHHVFAGLQGVLHVLLAGPHLT